MAELDTIRDALEKNIGKKVHIKTKRGRTKSCICTGTLVQTFPSVFTVRVQESSGVFLYSYSYSDILTRNVQLSLFPEQEEQIS